MMSYAGEKGEGPTALTVRGPQKGDWRFLHELGHTFQDSFDGNYTIATHGEVDVNLVPALVMNLVHDRTAWDNNCHSTFDAKTRIADWEKWNALPEAERTWAKACKMNIAYDFYFTLAECFGWDLYKKVFSRWMNWLQKPGSDASLDAIDSKNSNAKRDRFFVLFCEESKCNLLAYFQKVGLGKGEYGISPSICKKVEELPVWNGNQLIQSIEGPTEIKISKNTKPGTVIGAFRSIDPDVGTLFTYRLTRGNESGAFEIDQRTGKLSVVREVPSQKLTLTVEVQDNCIPLSTKQSFCTITVN